MNFDKTDLTLILLAVVAFIALRYYRKHFKVPKVGSLALVTGAVKSGKTLFALGLAIANYRIVHRAWRIKCFFCKLLRRECPEEPLFYSNIPVAFPYVELTKELILRQKRFRYGSVIFCSEASLLADNSVFKDTDVNERIMLLNKLIGHETRGGLLVYDTQAIGDLPAVTRRCIGQYFYVHHTVKNIPFVVLPCVRECRFSEDGSAVSVDTEDVEEGLKKVLFSKRLWKKYDRYCYSSFTDNKPVEDKLVVLPKGASLKAKNITSFKEYKNL